MIGYRSLGETELNFLILSENPVYGQQKINNYIGCGCQNNKYGMVSFFKELYKWADASHKYDVVVDLSKREVEEGIGTYLAAKDFGKTKVWTGREGKTEYKIEELYTRFYEPSDILSLNIRGRFADSYVNRVILPFCEKYNIKLER